MSGLEYWGRVCRWFGFVAVAVFLYVTMLVSDVSDSVNFEQVALIRNSISRANLDSDKLSYLDGLALTMLVSFASAVLFLILGYAAKKKKGDS
jgi:hypothetical protein